MNQTSPFLQMTGISKRFHGVQALQKVDFETAKMIVTLWGQFVQIGATNIVELVRQRINPDNNEQGDTNHGTES